MLQHLTHGPTAIVAKVNELIDQMNRLSSPLGSAGVQANQTLLGRGLAVSPAQLEPRWPKIGFGDSGGVTPKAWYLFNHNAKDASGNDYDGTFGGGMDADKDVAQFDGTDDYFDCGEDFLGTGAISISFWMYAFNRTGYLFDNSQFRVYFNAPFGKITISSDAGGTTVSASSGFTTKQWAHVVITRDADGVVNLWVNDTHEITDGDSGTPGDPGATHLRIGSTTGGASFYNKGLINDVRFYNEVITEEKRLELYEVGNKQYIYGDNIIKTATLFQVVSTATGDGVYNCYLCLIDATDWDDTAGADRFSQGGDTVEVLNLREGYVEADYTRGLARYDKIYAWLAADDEGNVRWVGLPIAPPVRMFKTTESATFNDHITCNAMMYNGAEAGSLDILYEVEVYCKICNGSALNEAAPRLADDDYLFAQHIRGKWWCTTLFDTDIECDCYEA